MKKLGGQDPRFLIGAAVLVWILSLSATRLITPVEREDSLWPEYSTVLVSKAYELAEVDSVLRSLGYTNYIGAYTTVFRYNDFGPVAQVRLTELESRFDPRDPRVDPYMRGVAAYFSASTAENSYHIVYLPGMDADQRKRLQHRSEESGVAMLPADAGSSGTGPLIIVSVITVVGGVLLSRRRAPYAGAGGVVLLAVVLRAADPVLTAGAVLIYLAWIFSFVSVVEGLTSQGQFLTSSPTKDRAGQSHVTVTAALLYLAAALLVAIALVVRYSTGAAIGVVVLTCAICACTGAATAIEWIRISSREHGVFAPISILPKRLQRPRCIPRDLLFAPLSAALVLFLIPLPGGEARDVLPDLPQPSSVTAESSSVTAESSSVTAESSSVTAESSSVTAESGYSEDIGSSHSHEAGMSANSLPTIDDYLAHRAYQESFMYGRAFRKPAPGEEIYVPEFRRNDGRIERHDRVVFRFDEEWTQEALAATRADDFSGIESVLLAADMPERVEFRPVRHVYWGRMELMRAVAPVALLLLVPVLARVGALFPNIDVGSSTVQRFYKRRNFEVV